MKIVERKERSKSRESLERRSVVQNDSVVCGKENRKESDVGRIDRVEQDRRMVERKEQERIANRKRTLNDKTGIGMKQPRISREKDLDMDELEKYEDNIEIEEVGVLSMRSAMGKDALSRKAANETGDNNDNVARTDWNKESVSSDVGNQGDTMVIRRDVEQRENTGVIERRGVDATGIPVVERTDSDASSVSSSSSTSSSGSSIAIYRGIGEGLRARAYRLLRRGAMPICPPAKRDWTAVIELEIECNGQKLCWPPTNWRQLTGDQKLMAHEYASLFLEKRKSADFPCISRKALLDKYSFLSIDGEGRPQEEDNDSDKVDGKIRQYNFAYLKSVAKGDIVGSRMSWSIVKSIENCDRWNDTDIITDKLDDFGVILRLYAITCSLWLD